MNASSVENPIVIVGLGQLGSLFREAFEGFGRRVVPVRRDADPSELARTTPDPELVLVTVGEDELVPVLDGLPAAWKARVGLVQNELRPEQWLRAAVHDPTVLVVWFERKGGQAPQAVRESVVAGPAAALLAEALAPFGVAPRLSDPSALPFELCLKNLYILTLNLCGLETRGTAGELLRAHRDLFEAVLSEVLAIEHRLFGSELTLDEARLKTELERAILADPTHGAAGRSAARRLERALGHAARLGLSVPTLERLALLPSP